MPITKLVDNVDSNLAPGAQASDAHPDWHKDAVVAVNATIDLAEGLQDGTNAFTGDIDAGSNKLTSLDDGTADSDAATKGQLDSAAEGASINAQTGTSYTLTLSDAGKLVILDNASAVTLTVPPNSSVAFPTGTVINLAQLGAGQVTAAEGSGVTVNQPATYTKKLTEQYAQATLIKTATDTWLLGGNLEAA